MTASVPGRPARRLPRGAERVVLDVVAAVAVVLLCGYAGSDRPTPLPVWQYGSLAVLIGAPLAVRRRWPVGVFVVVSAGATVALATRVIPAFAAAAPYAAVALALYQVAAALPRRRSLPPLAVSLLGTAAVGVLLPPDQGDLVSGVGFGWLLTGGVWMFGRTVRGRRADAARAAEQRARQAVTDERLRIARELHDGVAHSMSLIAVKAAIANHVAEQRPAEVRDALRIIESTSRDALTEMRRTLGVLRSGSRVRSSWTRRRDWPTCRGWSTAPPPPESGSTSTYAVSTGCPRASRWPRTASSRRR
ncbi:histidine kinase dimerization/phosphoacceptor domain-containing protein [Micromonospora zhanjiangensis]